MTKPYPADNPFLNGYYAPLHFEGDAAHLPITGNLPPELDGTLYRIGPNPQFAPRGRYEWFAGDGMLHEFRLNQGRASYRNVSGWAYHLEFLRRLRTIAVHQI